MTLYLENTDDRTLTEIAEVSGWNNIVRTIEDYCERELNYKVYRVRMYNHKASRCLDIGDWSRFFWLGKPPMDMLYV